MELRQTAGDTASRELEVESEELYVVYHGKTGAIAHLHRVVNHRGATPISKKSAEGRALELAGQFGHGGKEFRVLRAKDFDVEVAQRVDVKKGQLVAARPTSKARTAPGRRAKKR
jgi:hypothetical protein